MSIVDQTRESWRGTSHSPEETDRIAGIIGSLAHPGDLILLSGPLGAGKTQWVRGIARGMGLDAGQVHSPTFIIALLYDLPDANVRRPPASLLHMDAYRLSGHDELVTTGWGPIPGPGHRHLVVAVEWPERADLTPEMGLWIELTHAGENDREVEVVFGGMWGDRGGEFRQLIEREVNP
ncbi:MAG: tRNA (adenosine(37)-N6)-threonylcarbamoyltransferase complex ATPase subunit type 1 TsaE [Phycisphaeraceae bacterium]|nr:tRNA (adenosine(37)-N6)-threonylcarbamoyltransferase complex ATPase subunit type 1 TsaE [Phycisphaeraceae bacterium]